MEEGKAQAKVAVGALRRALLAEGVLRRAGPAPLGMTELVWSDLVRLLKDAPRLASGLSDFIEGQGPWPQSMAWHLPEVATWVAERHPDAAGFLADPKRFVDPLPLRNRRQAPPTAKPFEPGPPGELRVGSQALEAVGGYEALKAWVKAWRLGHGDRHGRLPAPLTLMPEAAWRDNELELRWAGQALAQLALERASVAVLAPPERDLAELPGGVPGAGPGGRPLLWRPMEECRSLRQAGWWVLKPRHLVGAWLEAMVLEGKLPSESTLIRSDAPDSSWAPPSLEPNAKGEVANGWLMPAGPSLMDLRRRDLEAALAAVGAPLDDRIELFGLGVGIPQGPHPEYLAQEAYKSGGLDIRLRRMLMANSLGPHRHQDSRWEAWSLVPQLAWRRLAPLGVARGGLLEVAAPDEATSAAMAELLAPDTHGLWRSPLQGQARQSLRQAVAKAVEGLSPPFLWVPHAWRPMLAPLLVGLVPSVQLIADEDLPPGLRLQVASELHWSA